MGASLRQFTTVDEWRAHVFNRLMLGFVATGISLWSVLLLQGVSGAYTWWALQAIGLLIAAGVMRRWSRKLRGSLLLVAFLTASGFVMFRSGFSLPNVYVIALLLAVILALTVGRALAWATILGFVIVQAAAAIHFSHGGELISGAHFDPSLPGNWLRVVGAFAALAGVAVTALTYVTHRMEAALRRNGELIVDLELEIKNRAQALKIRETLEAQLREADKLKSLGRLAGGVAHDFNNLLMIILGNVAVLEQALKPGDCSEERQGLQQAVELAQSLTQQLLIFGQVRVGPSESINLMDTVTKNIRLLRRLLPASTTVQIQGDSSGENSEPQEAWVSGCATELDQVVLNLCINAGEAMPRGGLVSIGIETRSCCRPDETLPTQFVVLTIGDSGDGMDAYTRTHLFEPFFTTKSQKGGTGLGLSIVHGIVQRHQGFLEVQSTSGKGTEISVFLPLISSSRVLEVTRQPLAQPTVALGTPILLAEDNAAVRRVIQRALTSAGFDVTACHDGALALTEFLRRPNFFKAVVTDAIMPVLGGRALYDAIRAQGHKLPFLFCSGYDASTLPPEFLEGPGRAFLLKPVTRQQLVLQLTQLLDEATSTRSNGD